MATAAPDPQYDRRAGLNDRRAANSNVTSIHRLPVVTADGMRVSWAGVFGGVLAAVGLLLLLASLGLAIGVTAVDPARTDAATMGSAAGIWAAASLLIALFVGGLVSTRAGAIHDRATSFWEGFLVWVVALLLVALMASSGISSLIGNIPQVLGTVQQAAAGLKQSAAQIQPAASMAAWATFGALVLSLLASVLGAAVGRRRYLPAVVR